MGQSPSVRTPGRWLAGATIGLLTLIWGTTWAAIRVSLEGIPPITGVALRFAIAGALLAVVARWKGIPLVSRSRREHGLRLCHTVLSFCVSYGVVFWAEQWVPSGLAAIVFATFTLFIVVMAHFVLPDERLTVRSVSGVLVGLAGIATIYCTDFASLGGRQVAFAAVVMLVAPVVSAVANVAIKKWGRDVHPVSLNAVAMLQGSVIMAIVAAVAEHGRPLDVDAASLGALLYLAVFGSAVTFTLYFWLLQHIRAGTLALIGYGTPVVAILVGCGLLDEPLTINVVTGALMVIVGVALATVRKREARASAGGERVVVPCPSPNPLPDTDQS
jgi:drug/metabolite transporter (DMT)-like permease